MRYYLVGCGKAKRAEQSAARELYVGNLFRAARAYVEAQESRPWWWVLSARHGLVKPDQRLEPYEQTMPTTVTGQRRWASVVLTQLEQQLGRAALAEAELVLLAGSRYTDGLRGLLEACGVAVLEPLRGLELGERLSWFKRQRLEGQRLEEQRAG